MIKILLFVLAIVGAVVGLVKWVKPLGIGDDERGFLKAPETSLTAVKAKEAKPEVVYVYEIKGSIDEKALKVLYPRLVMSSGRVIGRLDPAEVSQVNAALNLIDETKDNPGETADIIETVPFPQIELEADGSTPEIEIPETEWISFQFKNRPIDAELQSALQLYSLQTDAATGQVLGEVSRHSSPKIMEYLINLDKVRETLTLEAKLLSVRRSTSENKSFRWGAIVNGQQGFGNTLYTWLSQPGAISMAASNFQIALEHAVSEGRVRVLSEPSLGLTLGRPAQLQTGQEVGVPTSTVSEGVVQNQVVYRTVALVLDVTVNELPSGDYRVSIDQKSDEIIGTTEETGAPEISTQGFSSTLDLSIDRWRGVAGLERTVQSNNRLAGRFQLLSRSRNKSRDRSYTFLAVRLIADKPVAYARKL